jgi:hypothetical protein
VTIGRTAALAVVALGFGLGVAVVDSSPGWDSDGITAGLLLLGGAVATGVARGRRPWLWALLVGLPTPAIEIVQTGNTGSVLALVFAAVGAAIGWAVARTAWID